MRTMYHVFLCVEYSHVHFFGGNSTYALHILRKQASELRGMLSIRNTAVHWIGNRTNINIYKFLRVKPQRLKNDSDSPRPMAIIAV